MLEKLTYSTSSGISVGTIKSFVGDNTKIPYGWKLCNGDWLDKDDYKDLFSIIGTSFGDSGNTFRLPDLRDKFPKGVASSGEIVGCCGGCNKLIDHTHEHDLEACGQSHTGYADSSSTSHTHNCSAITGTVGGSDGSHYHCIFMENGWCLGWNLSLNANCCSAEVNSYGNRTGTYSACATGSCHGHGYDLTSVGQGGGYHNHYVCLDHTHPCSGVSGTIGCCNIPNNTDSRPEYQTIYYIIKY